MDLTWTKHDVVDKGKGKEYLNNCTAVIYCPARYQILAEGQRA